jgi:hypothetical protein
MKDMKDSGKRNKSSKTLEQGNAQCSLDQASIDKDQSPQEPCITFEAALEALDILIAQQGNQRIRDMHKGTIRNYLVKQEAKIQILDKYSKLWGWKDVDNHVEAMAKLWDEEDISCPVHRHE